MTGVFANKLVYRDVIAVDPGSPTSAAVARFRGDRLEIWRGFNTLRDIAAACRDAGDQIYPVPRVFIEFVHSMPGQGVVSTFSFGRGTGVAFGALLTKSWPIYEVSPQVWQTWYRTFIPMPSGAGTFDSRIVAPRVLAPEMLDVCRLRGGKRGPDGKKGLDHNACDAALLAVFGSCLPSDRLQEYLSDHS